MSRIGRKQYLEEMLDFILNQAEEDELDIIDTALKRRGRVASAADINFKSMAEQITERFDFEMPDFHGMSRDMVKNIILENVEQISVQELEILLDHYVPRDGGAARQNTNAQNLDPELLQTMIRQFIAFSLGKMDQSEERELRGNMPDWPERYWNSFDSQTQDWIRRTIKEAQ